MYKIRDTICSLLKAVGSVEKAEVDPLNHDSQIYSRVTKFVTANILSFPLVNDLPTYFSFNFS